MGVCHDFVMNINCLKRTNLGLKFANRYLGIKSFESLKRTNLGLKYIVNQC